MHELSWAHGNGSYVIQSQMLAGLCTPGEMTGVCMRYLAISGEDLDTYTVCFIVDSDKSCCMLAVCCLLRLPTMINHLTSIDKYQSRYIGHKKFKSWS